MNNAENMPEGVSRGRRTVTAIAPAFLGGRHEVVTYSFGPEDSAPRVYIQAGLHAGEHPGILVIHELIQVLGQLDEEGRLVGRIDLVPIANPIGMAQVINGELSGRYDMALGGNFNRNFPVIGPETISRLNDDGGAPVTLGRVRATVDEILYSIKCTDHVARLKIDRLRAALHADMVLDLHCDGESLLHIFSGEMIRDQTMQLARELGARVVAFGLLSDGQALEDVVNAFWQDISASGLLEPSGLQCGAMTVELRGRADVSPEYATKDAGAIIRFLRRQGLIAPTDYAPVQEQGGLTEINSDEVEILYAKVPGIISYQVPLGAKCHPGQLIAKVIDPTMGPEREYDLVTTRGGVLFSRHVSKLAFAGMEVCKLGIDRRNRKAR